MGGGGLVVGMPPAAAFVAALVEELLEKGLEKLNRLLDDETVDAGLSWFLAWICLTVTPPPAFFVLLANDDELLSDFLRLNFIVILSLLLLLLLLLISTAVFEYWMKKKPRFEGEQCIDLRLRERGCIEEDRGRKGSKFLANAENAAKARKVRLPLYSTWRICSPATIL